MQNLTISITNRHLRDTTSASASASTTSCSTTSATATAALAVICPLINLLGAVLAAITALLRLGRHWTTTI
jgi:hypothetical protein